MRVADRHGAIASRLMGNKRTLIAQSSKVGPHAMEEQQLTGTRRCCVEDTGPMVLVKAEAPEE